MLSLSGVSASQGAFYFEKEDYFFQGGEGNVIAGETYWNTGEKINHERFQEIVEARIRETGGALKGNDRLADNLSFSAPKSVSLLAALDDHHRELILEAHREAVKAVIDYIESSGMFQARDENGNPTAARGMLAVRFDHFTNRNGDPQLHSHVLIANVAERAGDGKVVSAYLREIYNHKIDLGLMYRMHCARNLEEMGYRIEWKKDGTFDLADFTEEQLRAFSTRRAEIEDYLKEHGLEGGKAAEVAAYRTRDPKKDFNPEELRKNWETRAREVGIKLPERQGNYDYQKEVAISSIAQKILEGVAEKQLSTKGYVREIDVQLEGVRALAKEGIYLWVGQIQNYAENALERAFSNQGGRHSLGQDRVGRNVWTVTNNLHAELRTRDIGLMNHSSSYALNPEKTKEILKSFEQGLGYHLTDEQKSAIEGIATGRGDAVVIGKAGTGKTTMLKGLKTVYQEQGRVVLGVSVSGAAAANLEKETGISSYTVDALNTLHLKGTFEHTRLQGGALVVDEAGMLDAKRTAAIQEFARAHGMKVVYVGDPDQLKPVGVGDPFRRLVSEAAKKGSLHELTEIFRQKDPEYREAARLASSGKTVEALEKLSEKGWVKEINSKKERLEAIKKDYLRAVEEKKSVLVVTDKNSIKDRLNREIRYELQKRGYVEKEGVKVEVRGSNGKSLGTREFAVGDRVLFLKNDRDLGVQNGLAGQVVLVHREEQSLVVRTDFGMKEVNLREYNYLDHGYATTVYKSQGQTVDRVIYNAESKSRSVSANSFYVAVTRGREEAKIYTDSLENLRERIDVSQEKADVLTRAAEVEAGARSLDERLQVRKDLDRDVVTLRESITASEADFKILNRVVNLQDYRDYFAGKDLKESMIDSIKREASKEILRKVIEERRPENQKEALDRAVESKTRDWHPEGAREELKNELKEELMKESHGKGRETGTLRGKGVDLDLKSGAGDRAKDMGSSRERETSRGKGKSLDIEVIEDPARDRSAGVEMGD
ncbi:MobF family relaxase [Thermodesulfatator autotrophicus]|uniref:TrwC relaxase domain-containing protein n=1 Tax=Thermodesulfatator autotrophicus TaxID=1795632 RepID=A0A177EBM9_9BACT|nr:MobF family relaxase [Thermodesulfatator autotrophicus]OAG28409.1 hypothetical protein TH606_02185 [Thermodesulfatator autotrophicus]